MYRLCFSVFLLLAACKSKAVPAPMTAPAPLAAARTPEQEPVRPPPPPPPPRPFNTAAPVKTLNGDPSGPQQEQLDNLQGEAEKKLQDCLDAMPQTVALPGGAARVAVRYELLPDGHTKDTNVSGEIPAETLDCAKKAVETMTTKPFSGPSLRSSFALTYHRAPAPDLAAK